MYLNGLKSKVYSFHSVQKGSGIIHVLKAPCVKFRGMCMARVWCLVKVTKNK